MERDAVHNPAAPVGSRRAAYLWWMIWVLWMPFIVPVAIAFVREGPGLTRLLGTLFGTLVFFALYVWMARRNALRLASPVPSPAPAGWRPWVPVIAMVALATALVLADGQQWGAMFIFAAACVAGWLPLTEAVAVLAGLTAIAAVPFAAGQSFAQFANSAGFIIVPGLTVAATTRSVQTSQRLRAEREELARQAAASEERLRIARDLHDLLGHDLAQMALKSEVAEYLAATAPDQAAAAMHEVAASARRALHEVRAAIAGYRRPTLDGELRAAREILAAAGMACAVEVEPLELAREVESALAWAVREGVTNTVKHSRARRCAIHLQRAGGELSLEVTDDGPGSGAPFRAAGDPPPSGLAGLRERVAAVGGAVEAGPLAGGGFRLKVVLPAHEAAAPIGSTSAAASTPASDAALESIR